MKEKLITIDYEEYLELEKCKGVIEDFKQILKEDKLTSEKIGFAVNNYVIKTKMPNSFYSMFRDELGCPKLSELIICRDTEEVRDEWKV